MNWKIVLAVLTCSTVLMSASYTMLVPFLPMYLIVELGVDQADVAWWCSLIFSVTFLISGAGVKLGSVFGARYKTKAEIAGGVILILLGLKILLEHLGVL